mgnify:FL=1
MEKKPKSNCIYVWCQQAVLDYLDGRGSLDDICKKYGICPRLKLQLWIKKYNNHEELKSSEIGEHTIMTKGRKTAFGDCTEKALKTNKKQTDY